MLDKLSQAERTRQNRRKTPKSPINIRNKIKELEFQLEKNHKLKESHKHLQHAPLQPITHHTTTATQLTFRNHNSLKNKFNFKSEEKKEAATNKNERVTLVANQAPSRQINSLKKNDEHPRRLNSPQSLRRKQLNESAGRLQQKQGDDKVKIYRNLMKENQRYKEIYSQSVEKLHHLEQRLHTMKEEHNHEKQELQNMIEQLKNRIEQKKTNNLAHIYSYEAQNNNFLVVKDKIITETDNQNSSSHLEPQKQRLITPAASLLSSQQK